MTVQHAFLVEFFRDHPLLLATLLQRQLGVPLPAFSTAQTSDADLTELPPEFRADLVLRFYFQNELALVVIVEVQLRRDPRKQRTWPAYVAVERARAGCPALLAVVSTDVEVAAWAAQRIDDGIPGGVSLRPLALGPQQVPFVQDRETAESDPDLALLSLVVHDHQPVPVAAVEGAIEGFKDLPPERSRLYSNLLTAVLREACRRGLLEKAMLDLLNGKYKDIMQGLFKEGFEEGLTKGELKGELKGETKGRVETRATALIEVLEGLFELHDEVLFDRVRSEERVELLERWFHDVTRLKDKAEVRALCARILDTPRRPR